LNAGIAADPEHPAAYDQLASILLEQGKLDEAEATFRRLISARPTAAAHQKLSEVLMRLGRAEEAQRELEMARALARGEGS
jgi:predicted Zn-dependent protease